jgi:alkylation response protein AidB-like acyl-CoA dehydrogenase
VSSTDAFAEAEAFRAEVRRFCDEALPADLRRKVLDDLWLDKADYVRWMRLLHERGWSAGHWPKRHGGRDWTPLQRYVFEEETAMAGAPWLIPFGVGMVGPVIYTFGSEEQKARFLPPILDTSEWWAQGYSEPGSGSDLASLRTRAVRDGAHWVVTGRSCGPATRNGRTGCLPGAHRGRRPPAGRYLVPADRHAHAGRDGAPGDHDGHGPPRQRGVPRRRARAGTGNLVGEAGPRLDVREVHCWATSACWSPRRAARRGSSSG